MIGWIRNWIRGIVLDVVDPGKVVPTTISHGSSPMVQIYKITNGYVVYKTSNGPYRDSGDSTVIFCATPLDVARQIVNAEALDKMGLGNIADQQMHTHGSASAKLGNQI